MYVKVIRLSQHVWWLLMITYHGTLFVWPAKSKHGSDAGGTVRACENGHIFRQYSAFIPAGPIGFAFRSTSQRPFLKSTILAPRTRAKLPDTGISLPEDHRISGAGTRTGIDCGFLNCITVWMIGDLDP